jgi:hypothetical protein
VARRIVIMDEFKEAAARLDPSTAQHIRDIAEYLARHPAGTPTLKGVDVHVLTTGSCGGLPALSLCYTFDADTLYLMDIEPYDALSG